MTVNRDVRIKRWRVVIPVTGSRWRTSTADAVRSDVFEGREGRLAATLTHADWPYTISIRATGDAPDGRGARGPVPLHLEFETRDLVLRPDAPRGWTLRLQSTEAPK
jgi:hypothetical protein